MNEQFLKRFNSKQLDFVDDFYFMTLILFADECDIKLNDEIELLRNKKNEIEAKIAKLLNSKEVKEYLKLSKNSKEYKTNISRIRSQLDNSLLKKCNCDFKVSDGYEPGYADGPDTEPSRVSMRCLLCGKHCGNFRLREIREDGFNFLTLDKGKIDEKKIEIIERVFQEACKQVSILGGYDKNVIKELLVEKLKQSELYDYCIQYLVP